MLLPQVPNVTQNNLVSPPSSFYLPLSHKLGELHFFCFPSSIQETTDSVGRGGVFMEAYGPLVSSWLQLWKCKAHKSTGGLVARHWRVQTHHGVGHAASLFSRGNWVKGTAYTEYSLIVDPVTSGTENQMNHYVEPGNTVALLTMTVNIFQVTRL